MAAENIAADVFDEASDSLVSTGDRFSGTTYRVLVRTSKGAEEFA